MSFKEAGTKFEFSPDELRRIVQEYGIQEIVIIQEKGEIRIDNQRDLHTFLVGIGAAEFVLDSDDHTVLDELGVPVIAPHSYAPRVRVLDMSRYGVPYVTHPVELVIGATHMWRIFANHRVPLPKTVDTNG